MNPGYPYGYPLYGFGDPWAGQQGRIYGYPGVPGIPLPPGYAHGRQAMGASHDPSTNATPSAEPRPGRFVIGLLVGAGVAYLLTNEAAQQAAIRSAVRGWHLVRGGVEELKERFRDAEAELQAGQAK